MLSEHGCRIAPSTYYDARRRGPSAREQRDEQWKAVIVETWRAQHRRYGARKLWLRLRRNGHDIARCTVERLMRELGLVGVIRGTRRKPADTAVKEIRPADLVDRHFARLRTNQLWVADFTYVWTWTGWVYVAFVFDAHSRRILGWRAATSMATPLVLDCLEMALFTRRREGTAGFDGLTHHTDAGSVGGFNWSSQHLDRGGVQQWRRSTGLRRRVMFRWGLDASGVQIERCGLRCARLGGLSPRGRCSGSSGV